MVTIPFKGRGRPRKDISNDEVTGQSEYSPDVSNGRRNDGDTGLVAREDLNGEGEGCSLEQFLTIVKAEKRLIASAWHPDCNRTLIDLNHCDIRFNKGEPSYQLSSGEIIKI